MTRVTTLIALYSCKNTIKFNRDFKVIIVRQEPNGLLHTYAEESSRLRPLHHCCTTDDAIRDFITRTGDGAIRGLNSSCVVVVVSCCAID